MRQVIRNVFLCTSMMVLLMQPYCRSCDTTSNPYVLTGIASAGVAAAVGLFKYIGDTTTLQRLKMEHDAQQVTRVSHEQGLIRLSNTIMELKAHYAEACKIAAQPYSEEMVLKLAEHVIPKAELTGSITLRALEAHLKTLKDFKELTVIIDKHAKLSSEYRDLVLYAQPLLPELDNLIEQLHILHDVLTHEAGFIQLYYEISKEYAQKYAAEIQLYAQHAQDITPSDQYLKELMLLVLMRMDQIKHVYPVLDYMAELTHDIQSIKKALSAVQAQALYNSLPLHKHLVSSAENLVTALTKTRDVMSVSERFNHDRVEKEQSVSLQKTADAEMRKAQAEEMRLRAKEQEVAELKRQNQLNERALVAKEHEIRLGVLFEPERQRLAQEASTWQASYQKIAHEKEELGKSFAALNNVYIDTHEKFKQLKEAHKKLDARDYQLRTQLMHLLQALAAKLNAPPVNPETVVYLREYLNSLLQLVNQAHIEVNR